jgi:hypothetical protein
VDSGSDVMHVVIPPRALIADHTYSPPLVRHATTT